MNKFEKLVDLIVKEDNKKAQKLFHEIVVEHSRTIYEGLIDDDDLNEADDQDDIEDLVTDIESDEEGLSESIRSKINVAEAKALLDYMDGTLKESSARRLLKKVCNHYQVTMEGLIPALEADGDELLDVAYGDEGEEEMPMDDSMDGEMDFDGSGEMDDHEMDHMAGDEAGEDMEDRVVDLEDAIDELKAEFDQLIGDDHMGDEQDFDGEEAEEGEEDAADDFEGAETAEETDEVEESIIREYVDKVSAPSNSESEGTNKSSTVAKPNRMGGTSANILPNTPDEKGNLKTENPKGHPGAGSFQNDPKAKAGKTSFKTKVKEPAKKESGVDKSSLLDGPKGKGRK